MSQDRNRKIVHYKGWYWDVVGDYVRECGLEFPSDHEVIHLINNDTIYNILKMDGRAIYELNGNVMFMEFNDYGSLQDVYNMKYVSKNFK